MAASLPESITGRESNPRLIWLLGRRTWRTPGRRAAITPRCFADQNLIVKLQMAKGDFVNTLAVMSCYGAE